MGFKVLEGESGKNYKLLPLASVAAFKVNECSKNMVVEHATLTEKLPMSL